MQMFSRTGSTLKLVRSQRKQMNAKKTKKKKNNRKQATKKTPRFSHKKGTSKATVSSKEDLKPKKCVKNKVSTGNSEKPTQLKEPF